MRGAALIVLTGGGGGGGGGAGGGGGGGGGEGLLLVFRSRALAPVYHDSVPENKASVTAALSDH